MKKSPINKTTSVSFPSALQGPKRYSSILATEEHEPVIYLSQFPRFGQIQMGFFLNGKAIGSGALKRCRSVMGQTNKSLQTENTGLNRKSRRKGHGLHLYFHLIAHAKACGAERIYSSKSLNKRSRPMWEKKLAKYFDVKVVSTKKCSKCGCRSKSLEPRCYYIQLKGK